MTQEDNRDKAPSAEEIERRFHSMKVLVARPMVWGTIAALKVLRRFDWQGQYEVDLRSLNGPMIFAANHRSHCDTAAILDTLPAAICKRTVVAAALDVFGPDSQGALHRKISKSCLQFAVAAGFHAFAFDRLGPPLRSVRTSVQLIRNGWSLLLYPEGTRSRTNEMAAFKAGVGLLARFTQRPVVPIHVNGGEIVLPYNGFLPQPGQVQVRYGSPMLYREDDTPISFVARLEDQVRQLETRQATNAVAVAGSRAAGLGTRPRKQPA